MHRDLAERLCVVSAVRVQAFRQPVRAERAEAGNVRDAGATAARIIGEAMTFGAAAPHCSLFWVSWAAAIALGLALSP